MPRWLSEGISVYEEREADSTWGQAMTPQYREIILSGKMTPVSRLSSAFLAPPSPLHLQFAYYESSLVVEYLVDKYGRDALAAILTDLGEGMEINLALMRHTASLGRLDAEFAKFARQRAEGLAPDATWEEPEMPAGADAAAIGEWVAEHPKSVPGLQRWARQLLRERKFAEAIAAADELRQLFADDAGDVDALRFLAAAQRGLSDTAAEQKVLEELAGRDADASDAFLRLMELAAEQGDWPAVAKNARRMLAVNPLVAAPHRYLAQAADKLGQRADAIRAFRALLQFDTTDPAETHFRLAKLLDDVGEREPARRQVLMALEEAPRFLEAHRLLLDLTDGEVASATGNVLEKTTEKSNARSEEPTEAVPQ
jgi:tetratricopeptide (TPR) repeat protein